MKTFKELKKPNIPIFQYSIYSNLKKIPMSCADNVLEMIGSTYMINLKKVTNANIFAKAEFLNPGGSIKDRVALYIIEEAERKGKLKKGMTIVEATSGNTGIAVAMVGLIKGYPVKIIMPENMSEERKKIIKSFNAELILIPCKKGMARALEKLDEIKKDNKNIFAVGQFENPDNPKTHYCTTGPEIWEQLNHHDHHVDIFVAGVGTGGTLAGISRFLKERNPKIIITAVEPKNASALLGHQPGLHRIEGIGDGFIPDVLDPSIIDEIIEVSDEDAIQTSRRLAKETGLLVGTSSGANVWAAMKLSEKFGKDKVIATILADRAERYFSTNLI